VMVNIDERGRERKGKSLERAWQKDKMRERKQGLRDLDERCDSTVA
jgi:hypothetical protein